MARAKHHPPPQPKALEPLPPNTQAILRSGVEAVAYHIPVVPPSPTDSLLKTTIALPRRSSWTSGLHFHTGHTEHLRLIKGSIFVYLDGDLRIISAKAGGEVSSKTGEILKSGLEIIVDKYVRHDWGRADEYLYSRWSGRGLHGNILYAEDSYEEVVVEEWTDPADMTKPLFFWNLNAVITAPQNKPLSASQNLIKLALGSWWIPFQLSIIFWDLDNWPILLDLRLLASPYLGEKVGTCFERLSEYLMTFVVLFAAKELGRFTGIQSVSKERTPKDLWHVYKKS
ncbi:uncharacterized protein K460DRAFT_355090 [Cucurbitaria berberidis CBS 394.84]|uniref:Uncharacterized protein n=1 Tax=Cucurbitaria berberidis CBS 394.84 TaxID=1168544 RepID=A0A9P4GGY7_9PLEO|nr:uncharacterized protein K460DRAFT_355090 [Cucurbitaria berberidis CBS 394.84]KAF1845251.1 hypothetical protein K460DRAFT_355090 [Cucurbitaria berberidis CBS 394.84]